MIPYIGWLIKNRNLFLTVVKVGKSKTVLPAHSVSCEDLLLGSKIAVFWQCLYKAEGQGSSLGSRVDKGTNPIHEDSS